MRWYCCRHAWQSMSEKSRQYELEVAFVSYAYVSVCAAKILRFVPELRESTSLCLYICISVVVVIVFNFHSASWKDMRHLYDSYGRRSCGKEALAKLKSSQPHHMCARAHTHIYVKYNKNSAVSHASHTHRLDVWDKAQRNFNQHQLPHQLWLALQTQVYVCAATTCRGYEKL